MALARSASGPGGLSISTGTANSLFGSSTTIPAAGTTSTSLFGGAAGNQPAATGGLFGSATTSAPAAPATTQASGGLFGSLNTAPKPAAGTGLFGSLATAPPLTQSSTPGFGSTNTTATSQPQQTGGLFGSTTTSQPQQTSSLFSGLNTQNAQNQGSDTGGLFGANTTAQPAQTGGLFSGLNTQTTNKPATSLFSGLNTSTNQQTQPAQQQSGGLFASLNQSSQPTANNAFGSTLGGGLKLGQAQQGQQVPGVRIDVSQMKGTTRFNDLHEDLQKQIEMIDKIILAQQSRAADCDAILPTHSQQLSSIPVDVDFLSKKVIGVESSLESDAEAVALVGQLVRTDAEHAKLSFKAIDNLKLPPQYHSQGNWMGKSGATPQGQSSSESQDLVSYFSRTADEMSSTLSKYQSYIGEIEQHLRTVEATTIQQAQQLNGHGMSDDVDNQKRELASVLREFEAGIRGVAGEVAAAREGVQKLQLGGYIESSGDRRKNHNGKRVGIY